MPTPEYFFENFSKPYTIYVEGSGGEFLATDSSSGYPYRTDISNAKWFSSLDGLRPLRDVIQNEKTRILRLTKMEFEDHTVSAIAEEEYHKELAALNKKYGK